MGERSRFKQISWLPVAGRGPMAPLQPPGTPLSEQGESAVCQDCSYHLGAPTGAFCSALMAVLSPVPYPPQPHSSFLSAEPCASLGERRNPPPRPRTVESCLVRHYWGARALSCPYQSQGQSVWLEDWNLNAIVSDFVTFLFGRVNPPPSCSLACVLALPCPGHCPSTLQPGECCCLSVKRFLCVLEPAWR